MNLKFVMRSFLKLVLTIFLFGLSFAVFAQDSLRLSTLNALPWLEVQDTFKPIGTDKQLTAQAFLKINRESVKEETNTNAIWYQVIFINDLPDTQTVFFSFYGNVERINAYTVCKNVIIDSSKSGYRLPFSKRNVPKRSNYIQVEIPPLAQKTVLVKLFNITNKELWIKNFILQGSLFKYYFLSEELPLSVGISIAFQGAMLVMILYMLFLFFQNNRNYLYLRYAIFMLSVMLYMLLKLAFNGPFYFFMSEYPLLKVALNEFLQFIMMITYILFAIKFLKIKQNAPNLYKLMLGINTAYLSYAVFIAVYFLVSKDILTVNAFFAPTRISFFILSCVVIIWSAIFIKGPLVKYLVWGSSIALIGNLLAIIYSLEMRGTISSLPAIFISPVNFTQISTVIEILFFSLGMGKAIQISNREKEQISQANIALLIKNENLNETHKAELEEKIVARSQEIIVKNKELADIREKRKETEFTSKLMDTEMRLLRLQMNPHFIFNSLNSIRYFILKQNEEKAIEYIESFSMLLRMILDHSKRKFISLQEELNALELFMKFEKARFNHKFNYKILVDKGVKARHIAIQPLLLQPFVENSIWHGLMHKDDVGSLTININKCAVNALCIVVEDNGVGREKASEIKAKKGKTHKSHGTEITKNRIDALNEMMQEKSGFIIDDLKTHSGKVLGTRVTLTLNIIKYEGATN